MEMETFLRDKLLLTMQCSDCIILWIVLVSTAPINVQVSGFLKTTPPRHRLVPPLFQASVRHARINLQSPLSLERLSSLHSALFLFSLSCPSWFPTAECYLQIVGAVGYFYDKVSKYPGDEETVFREHKSNSSYLFPLGWMKVVTCSSLAAAAAEAFWSLDLAEMLMGILNYQISAPCFISAKPHYVIHLLYRNL